ncbi:MAG: hypothetical protein WCS01_11435 [bacterium]
MPFRLFHDLYPEVAERETRSVFLPTDQNGLPAGGYAFKEMFCDEPGCDCRRAFFCVDASFREGPEAVIAWGWEDLAFYERWIRHGDKSDARELIGPSLNLLSPGTELAPPLLDLFERVLLNDATYVERVKRHYRMFREAIEASVAGTDDTDAGTVTPDGDDQPEESQDMKTTRDPMTGECFLCHASVPKAQASRHVTACLKARPYEAGQRVKALHLRVEGKYNPEYWMHIEIASARTLYDLDGFLRKTWLECCHHLSCFTINGHRYAYEPYHDSFSGRREKSMETKLYKTVPPGSKFTHEYDYGSTTDLVLRSLGTHETIFVGAVVRLLARNAPPEVQCVACKQPATMLEIGWNGLNRERCFCEACGLAKMEEGMRLPIVNSPRVGVCAYCG